MHFSRGVTRRIKETATASGLRSTRRIKSRCRVTRQFALCSVFLRKPLTRLSLSLSHVLSLFRSFSSQLAYKSIHSLERRRKKKRETSCFSLPLSLSESWISISRWINQSIGRSNDLLGSLQRSVYSLNSDAIARTCPWVAFKN